MPEISAYDVDLVHIIRNEQLDCVHRGRIVIVDRTGSMIFAAGDVYAPGYLRSIAKPFQAVSIIETGADERFRFSDHELAVAAGSHSGTPYHTGIVANLLQKLGLTPASLHCGAIPPLNRAAYEALLLSGHRPTTLHHNCSGKHSGMLACCLTQGWDTAHYTAFDHPVQQHILATIANFADLSPAAIDLSPDGCSVPTFGIPLVNVAVMFMQLGLAAANTPAGRIAQIMQAHPQTYSGEGRLDADLVLETGGRLIVKDGAEGIVGVAVPDFGVGIALKVSDGNQRAIMPALLQIMRHFGYISDDEAARLEAKYPPVILNLAGTLAAEVRVVLVL